ncbi:helix-turn-helix domain-containing protein [Williamsia sp. MIQD14]|uniref:helix-turn-helix transcriptional regulator n=1 Tax=Williamsia sp. MIQD14 TaxID=3425703 RepID=UPI003D9FDED8
MRGFVPERLRAARENAGLTQGDLARMADVGRTTVYQWENGTATPQVDILARVIRTLDIAMTEVVVIADDELFPGDLRVRRGLTQPQLGKAAGLSTGLISAIEHGEVQLAAATADALAAALNVSTDTLIAAHARVRQRPAGSAV